ncbi:hypothetical protein ACIQXQ_09435 [Peribacillus sp. NPDC097198]|uniref:hypothetical protein n=1 Tax=Peribacillus sp. NPDC097198 TaxID=3364397 RepID=UPI003808F980
MSSDLIKILNGGTEKEPFNKSHEYLINVKNYNPVQAMNLLLKEPTVFLAPVTFIMFRADTKLNITMKDYAMIIMKQARNKNNQKLFEVAHATYKIAMNVDL